MRFLLVLYHGILAQLGEHLPYKQRVTGSSPVGPINQFHIDYAAVAELADAQDLKSCGTNLPYRFDSGLRHERKSEVDITISGFLFCSIKNFNKVVLFYNMTYKCHIIRVIIKYLIDGERIEKQAVLNEDAIY